MTQDDQDKLVPGHASYPPRSAAMEAVIASLMYAACSNVMVLSNKAVLSYFNFRYPLWLMAFQSLCAATIMETGRRAGLIKCDAIETKTALRLLPINLLFVTMITTAGFATQHLSVPLLTVFKNLTNILITFGEQRLFEKPVSKGVILSILVMVAGSLYAAVNDIQFNALGYFWISINCVTTAVYLLYIKFVSDSLHLSKDTMALYNNTMGLPITALLAFFLEGSAADYDGYGSWPFVAVFVTSGIVGWAMSLASFYAMEKTSPTTYSMVGAINKIPASVLGAVFFDAIISPRGWVGILIGLFGGILFALVKASESRTSTAVAVMQTVPNDSDEEDLLPR